MALAAGLGRYCWPERGAFDLRFETTWGSSESENPLGEGTVEFSNYQLGGKEQSFDLAGAIAGFEEDDGRTDKNRASVSIISLGKDFAIDVLTVSLPIDWVESGANLPIDMEAVSGYRLSLPSPDSPPNQFELIAKGGIEFSEASTEPGAKISGRFYGTLFSFGGGEDVVSGDGDAEAGGRDRTGYQRGRRARRSARLV